MNNKNVQFEKKSDYVERNIEDFWAFMGSDFRE